MKETIVNFLNKKSLHSALLKEFETCEKLTCGVLGYSAVFTTAKTKANAARRLIILLLGRLFERF